MKNILKYVVISSGMLFLASFLLVEKTYGAYCLCGNSPYGCLCCTCTCACGCYRGCNNNGSKNCKEPTHPDYCANGEYRSSQCTYSCTCPSRCENGCNSNGTCKCPTYCQNGCTTNGTCYCSSTCPNGCETDGSCKCVGCDYGCYSDGSCKPTPTCSVYNSYCVDQNGAGSYSIWSPISQSCVCVEPPVPNPTCPADQVCGDSCCPADTICQNFSGALRCTSPEPPVPPTPPTPPANTAPTAPTSLQTEGLTNPTSVSDLIPEFSAIFNDPDASDSSNYYQIQVNTNSSFTGTVMWNSNKTSMTSTPKGSRSPQLSYAGSTLTLNGITYYWRIKFWDVGGLESPWSATANFKLCTNADCNPSDYCKPNGWAPVPITPESIPLEDIVHCTSVISCTTTEKYGDCYEDPHLECTKDTDCEEGECCRGYTCTTDCSPVVHCNADSECGTNKCCVGKECGNCISDDSQTLQLTVGSKISNIVVVSLWDRILAMFRKLNTYFY